MNKGTLRIVEGDATEPQKLTPKEVVIIPHVCNNENKWGAGFVMALNKKWSEPEKEYRDLCERRLPFPFLGEVCYAKINNFLVVANMIGQSGTVSTNNPIPLKYAALISCMNKVVDYIERIKKQTSNPVVIHAPKFGSKLAGGNFDFILELIREIWLENGLDVVVYEFVPAEMRNRVKKDLWRTDITIWTEDDPLGGNGYESLAHLAREAEQGDCYCAGQTSVEVKDIYLNGDGEVYDGLTEFFFGYEKSLGALE